MHRAFLTLAIAALPLLAQDAASQKKFAGAWEAKFKDKVICTLTLREGEKISGEARGCSINVDGDGNLEEPTEADSSAEPSRLLNPSLHDDTLSFEIKDDEGEEALKFELKLTGEGQAELRVISAPVAIKPIPFKRT